MHTSNQIPRTLHFCDKQVER